MILSRTRIGKITLLALAPFGILVPATIARPKRAPAAPDFQFSVDGHRYVLSVLRGKIVVLDFWASWCGPCQRSLPEISRLSGKYRDVVFLGVNSENPAVIERTRRNLRLSFPTVYDSDGAITDLFGVRALPTTIVIDHNRRIIAFVEGVRPDGSIERAIEQAQRGSVSLLKGHADAPAAEKLASQLSPRPVLNNVFVFESHAEV